MPALVIAEHDGHRLKPATLNTIYAAQRLATDVAVLVAGDELAGAEREASAVPGVTIVFAATAPHLAHGLAENLAPLITSLAEGFDYLLAPATTFGKNVMPRVAALLNVAQVSDVIAIVDPDTFERPIYAGNAIATVRATDAKKVITVRPTAFPAAASTGGAAEIKPVAAPQDTGLSRFVEAQLTRSARPELQTARIVVSGGRGMQNAESFRLLEEVADKLGAAVGASRAAVDAGFVPNDYQVGQTGKVVAPELYIAVGISGAIQHLAGMKDSKVIVAINKDEEAPIFEVADYGLVADLFEALPKLSAELDKLKTG